MNILVLFGHGNKPGLLRLLGAVEKKLVEKGYRFYHAIENDNDTFLNYGFKEDSVCRVRDLKNRKGFFPSLLRGGSEKTLEKFCQDKEINLILSYTLSTLPVSTRASKKTGIPCAVWLHNHYEDAPKRYRKYSLRDCNAVISVSEFVMSSVREYLGETDKKLFVAHNAIDIDNFLKQADELEVPKELKQIGPHDIVIGMVAAMDRNKNPQLLLRAVAQVRNEEPEARLKLLFAGRFPDAGYEEETRQLASDLELNDEVVFLGFQQNVSAIYRAMDIFVHPTGRDAFSLSCAEAMAWGKPVIASRAGGVPEVVTEGVTGILCEPGNVNQFAEAIKRLFDSPDLRTEMGARGKERMNEMFTMGHLSGNLDQFFQEYSR